MAKEKNTSLDGLKRITKWLLTGNLNEKNLENIIDEYKITNQTVAKLFSFIYNYPSLVIYLNKYMNTIYINNINVKDIIYTFGTLFFERRINSTKEILYLKTDFEKINKLKLLKENLDSICSTDFNKNELEFYYLLSDKLNIPIEVIEKETISNKFKTPKSTIIQKNQEIINLSESIKELKKTRELCRTCPLYNQPIVTFDTNVENLGDPVDVVFIALNPGTKEKEVGIPLVGKAGKIFRTQLEEKITGKWLITNIILCHTANETDMRKLGDPKDIASHCNELVNQIISHFPSKIFVPLGKVAASMMGLEDYTNGNLYQITNDIFAFPIIHPSALNYGSNQKKKEEFESNFKALKNAIDSLTSNSSNEESIEIDESWTLFDACELNNQVLLIYIDKDGNKKYIKKPLEIKVLINNSEWNNLSMLTSTIHQSYSVNAIEKNLLTAAARNRLSKIKRV